MDRTGLYQDFLEFRGLFPDSAFPIKACEVTQRSQRVRFAANHFMDQVNGGKTSTGWPSFPRLKPGKSRKKCSIRATSQEGDSGPRNLESVTAGDAQVEERGGSKRRGASTVPLLACGSPSSQAPDASKGNCGEERHTGQQRLQGQ